MKTRGRPSKSATKPATETVEKDTSTNPKVQLEPDSANPPQLFILPKDKSKDARIVTLQNPRYLSDSRYLICPENGFYEFTKVAAPRTTPRSWLLSGSESNEVKEPDAKRRKHSGYVTKSAEMLVATAIDPLFVVLSVLAPLPTSKGSEAPKKLFLSGDDYIEKIATASPHFGGFSRIKSIRDLLEQRMAAVCDTVEAGDENMYRLNEEKLFGELLKKAKNMCETGLPPSMEEKLVRKALDIPVLSIKREDSSLHELVNEEAETPDTQTCVSTIESAGTSFSEASTAATSFSDDPIIESKPKAIPPINAPEGVVDLLRLRTALYFICAAYLAPHVTETVKKMAASSASVDFAPLEAHLAHLAKLRQDALASRSLGDFSRKRLAAEDIETRAEKKRKEDEEEKRKKANESRGVKALKKVNVTGMKKMSDFFKKK
ncbi:uncharacterized protein LY89DRAFT_444458 [Mollisia scopiformis]|uniref:Ribonuclease H2 subunit B n=1 Tax=Mollisia scopiformis TaxID=149040 RepID=A0A194XL31_MOLSC|nr:uncharacterized protein LY89DRAFT_444458 [Mollisia scopiformis]KUJ20482.1 hypothetical protein LY89DRAFT_444458 [Mollisia scopiformis]